MIKYAVLISPHLTSFMTGAVLKVEKSTLKKDWYVVEEGYCSAIHRSAIKFISKDEYNITRGIHGKLRKLTEYMDDETKEYIDELTMVKQ